MHLHTHFVHTSIYTYLYIYTQRYLKLARDVPQSEWSLPGTGVRKGQLSVEEVICYTLRDSLDAALLRHTSSTADVAPNTDLLAPTDLIPCSADVAPNADLIAHSDLIPSSANVASADDVAVTSSAYEREEGVLIPKVGSCHIHACGREDINVRCLGKFPPIHLPLTY